MVQILSGILVCFLVGFGALIFISSIINSNRQRIYNENSTIRLVLIIKDQEEKVEGMLRNIYSSNMLGKVMTGKKLAVIDMGSSDKTMEILIKLKEDYDFFDIFRENEMQEIFKEFKI